MDNPITAVKQNVSISKILGFIILALVVFALFDAVGITPWILTPYSQIKAKFFNKTASS